MLYASGAAIPLAAWRLLGAASIAGHSQARCGRLVASLGSVDVRWARNEEGEEIEPLTSSDSPTTIKLVPCMKIAIACLESWQVLVFETLVVEFRLKMHVQLVLVKPNCVRRSIGRKRCTASIFPNTNCACATAAGLHWLQCH